MKGKLIRTIDCNDIDLLIHYGELARKNEVILENRKTEYLVDVYAHKPSRYECDVCRDGYNNKKSLIEHLRTHYDNSYHEMDTANGQLEELGSHPEL